MPINIDTIALDGGAHSSIEKGACVMELVSHVAGEEWSDSPSCTSPILAGYLRNLNDAFDTEARQALKPLIPLCIGTNTGAEDDQKRGRMAVDWIVREYVPAWLDLAKLDVRAKHLRSLPEITSWDALVESMSTLRAAQADAAAAWAAAWAAAGAAAWAAAGAAAGDATLAPTVTKLQASAIELAKRMAQRPHSAQPKPGDGETGAQ